MPSFFFYSSPQPGALPDCALCFSLPSAARPAANAHGAQPSRSLSARVPVSPSPCCSPVCAPFVHGRRPPSIPSRRPRAVCSPLLAVLSCSPSKLPCWLHPARLCVLRIASAVLARAKLFARQRSSSSSLRALLAVVASSSPDFALSPSSALLLPVYISHDCLL
jgi:hypothetical protein